MSPPDHFEIAYSINPWMNLDNKVDQSRAAIQWHSLATTYSNLGLSTLTIPASPGLPDLVFTTDHGVWIGDTFYLANFRYDVRESEQSFTIPWYQDLGIKLHHLPSYCYLEGGDVIFHDQHIFVGYGFRTSYETIEYLHNTTHFPVVPLELVDEAFYHLDTCFLPLTEELAFYYPPAFSMASIKALKAHFDLLLPLSSHEAEGFACNSVKLGTKIICQPNPSFEQKLAELGFTPLLQEMTEFNKSGGGIHCLSQIIST